VKPGEVARLFWGWPGDPMQDAGGVSVWLRAIAGTEAGLTA